MLSIPRVHALLCALALLLAAQSAFAFDPQVGTSSLDFPAAIAVQPDGRVVIVGNFFFVGGQPRGRVARLLQDGSLDLDFNPGANNIVSAVALQPDGKIVIGGQFTTVAGEPRNRLARLHADGSLDESFNPDIGGTVRQIALQTDGNILIAGDFSSVGGETRNRVARLNPDGSLDMSFVNPIVSNIVFGMALQPDGRILIGGTFTAVASVVRNRIARLNPDGSLDMDFDPNADSTVSTIMLQPDNKILIGGAFDSVMGSARGRLARLNPDGTLDAGFVANATGNIATLALQADGRIVVGGQFNAIGGQLRNRLARLDADGTVDATFHPLPSGGDNFNWRFVSLAVQPDGKLLVGCTACFLTSLVGQIAGQPRVGMARLHPDGSVDILALRPLDFGPVVVGSTSPVRSVEIRNTGQPGTVEIAAIEAPAAPFTAVGGSCVTPPFVLDSGESCSVDYSFTPPGEGDFSLDIGVDTDTPTGLESFRLSGAGVLTGSPALTVTPENINFGKTQVGDERAELVTLENTGNVTLTLSGVSADPAPPFFAEPLAASDCGTQGLSLEPAETCTLALRCAPQTLGFFDGIANIESDDPASPAGVTLACVGNSGFDPDLPAGGLNDMGILVQPDGRIVVGGNFQSVSSVPRWRLARLFSDGDLELGFDPSLDAGITSGRWARALTLQEDGKLLAGGLFADVGGQPRNNIVRLNADGSLDPDFAPDVSHRVQAMAMQPDGRIVIGGDFTTINGDPYTRLARLHPGGSVDDGFNPQVSALVNALALQPDGKIVIGGLFTDVNGQPVRGIARFNADGSLDPDFQLTGPNELSRIEAIVLQPDGKIVIGDRAGGNRDRVVRLNSDGTRDPSFCSGEVTGGNCAGDGGLSTVTALALQADGKVLVGQSAGARLTRLHPDGSRDQDFDPQVNSTVNAIALQPDGKILIGGRFTLVGGLPRNGMARLHPDGSLDTDAAAGLGLAPDPLDFGAVVVGDTAVQAVTVTNTGFGALDLAGLTAPAAPFVVEDLAASDCGDQGLSLAPGGSCTFDVSCAPAASGTFADTLVLDSNAPDAPHSLALACAGIAAEPELTVAPATLDFGPVDAGASAGPLAVTLSSTGNAPVQVSAIDTAQAPFAAAGGSCPAPPFALAADDDCTLAYTFAPTGGGPFGQVIEIDTANAGGHGFELAGTGVLAPAVIDVDPTSLIFDVDVDGSASDTLLIGNAGVASLLWSIDSAQPSAAPVAGRTPLASAFAEDFDAIGTLPASGWALLNQSQPAGVTGWFQGNPAAFGSQQGASNAYVAADFENTAGGTGTISNWLLTPELLLLDGGELRFWTRTVAGSQFPDRLQVRLSTAGASTEVGAGATDVGDFDTLLLAINPNLQQGGYPTTWTEYVIGLEGLPGGIASGRIGFRYFVTSAGPSGSNSNYIGIDTVRYDPGCGTPASIDWLDIDPLAGSVDGGDVADVQVGVNAKDMAAGGYSALLCIESNDPVAPMVTVPVWLQVMDDGDGIFRNGFENETP